jgi:thiol-disulfide isomerase/thioredoxin
MKLNRGLTLSTLALAGLLVAGVLSMNHRAESQEEAVNPPGATESADSAKVDSAVEPAAATAPAELFKVPEGGVAEQLSFLELITKPSQRFSSVDEANAYWRQAAGAMSDSSERILKAPEATAEQAAEAVQFKAEALRIQGMLGEKDTEKARNEFLDATLKDPRFEVSSIVGPIRLIPKLRRWSQLTPAEQTKVIDTFVADVKAAGPTPGQAQLLMSLTDALSDSPHESHAARALEQLLPVFAKSDDATVQEIASMLEGVDRRLRLPGNKLELAGTQIDGQPFDWESYRGKVVLVDFWASWCPQCLAETPNIVQAYEDYHDKGFEVVGVCLDSEKAKGVAAAEEHGMVWAQLFDPDQTPGGWTHPMAEKYAITGIPRLILVDKEGKVVNMMAYGRSLRADLERLLGPPSSESAASPRVGAAKSPASASQ